jgi:hypothetical protein
MKRSCLDRITQHERRRSRAWLCGSLRDLTVVVDIGAVRDGEVNATDAAVFGTDTPHDAGCSLFHTPSGASTGRLCGSLHI